MEILAILSSLAYTVLYLLESAWCWPLAILGSLIYFYLCRKANLQGESWLQLFYVGFAVYGWMASGNAFQDPNWIWTTHMFFAIGTIALWQILSYVLKQRKSALPQLDGFVLAIALAGTILQLLYIELNWYYFILVNITSIYTYWNRGMKKSVILYLVYLGLSVYGIIH